jgi:hypothetical protein
MLGEYYKIRTSWAVDDKHRPWAGARAVMVVHENDSTKLATA